MDENYGVHKFNVTWNINLNSHQVEGKCVIKDKTLIFSNPKDQRWKPIKNSNGIERSKIG